MTISFGHSRQRRITRADLPVNEKTHDVGAIVRLVAECTDQQEPESTVSFETGPPFLRVGGVILQTGGGLFF